MTITNNYFEVRENVLMEFRELDDIGPITADLKHHAIEAMRGGFGSMAMRDLMIRFAKSEMELGRLLGTDGTESDPQMNTARAFIVDNALRGFGTLQLDPSVLEVLDNGFNGHSDHRMQSSFSDKEVLVLSESEMTPTFLMSSVTPFVVALEQLQRLIDQMRGEQVTKVRVKSITQKSPIGIDLTGAKEAIELILNLVIPWRRKHEKTMARYAEKEKRAELELKRVDVESKVFKDQAEAEKMLSEARKIDVETARAELEIARLKLEFEKEKLELIMTAIDSVAPNLPAEERIKYFESLSHPIKQIATSELLRLQP